MQCGDGLFLAVFMHQHCQEPGHHSAPVSWAQIAEIEVFAETLDLCQGLFPGCLESKPTSPVQGSAAASGVTWKRGSPPCCRTSGESILPQPHLGNASKPFLTFRSSLSANAMMPSKIITLAPYRVFCGVKMDVIRHRTPVQRCPVPGNISGL